MISKKEKVKREWKKNKVDHARHIFAGYINLNISDVIENAKEKFCNVIFDHLTVDKVVDFLV